MSFTKEQRIVNQFVGSTKAEREVISTEDNPQFVLPNYSGVKNLKVITDLQSSLPVGTILLWGTNTAPTNFLMCDGSSRNRTFYSALFAVIGTKYGFLDANSFNLPETRDKFIRGGRITEAESGGSDTHSHELSGDTDTGYANVSDSGHYHTINSGNSGDSVVQNTNFVPQYAYTDTGNANVSDSGHAHSLSNAGSTNDGSSIPSYLGLFYIIKYQ